MPKKKTKSRKKSPKAKAKASKAKPPQQGEVLPEEAADAPKPKKIGPACRFCKKPMRDEKTLKLHERNCRAKAQPAPEPEAGKGRMESAILELKDQVRDQVEAMSKAMQEREEQHEKELEEVRTVLRMEVDRHRKELERLSKVEREVATEQTAPEPEPQPVQPNEPEQPSPRTPDGRPRAIDMLPLPMPTVPKRHYTPLPEDESIPDIDAEEVPAAQEEVPASPGLDRGELEAMVRDIVGNTQPKVIPADDGSITVKRLDALESKIDRAMSDIRRMLDKTSGDEAQKRFEKDLARISERVQDIMEDSGYGESLSVSKIPPTILEIVYQAILDDIHHEIIKTKGNQDAERIARSALEEVRLKTSGSELFKFDGRKIVTDSLAKSIEANMISAKQIQTTYDVLLDKLLETVPHHKAKNFKGMIKVKSQEFAVDRATKLTKEFAKSEKTVESTNQMVAAMAANFNARNMELHETMEEMKNNTLATKADREDIDALRTKVEDSLERVMGMSTDIALLKAQLEMKESIKAAEEARPAEVPTEAGEILLAPGEMPSATESESPERAADSAATEEKILDCVRNGKDSKTAIVRDSGLEETQVADAIARLVEGKKLIEKKSGKRVKYTTLDKEIEQKLDAVKEEPAPKKPKKGRKAKAKEERAGEPVPTEVHEAEAEVRPELPETKPEELPVEEALGKEQPQEMEQEADPKESAPVPESKPETAEEPKPKKKGKKAKGKKEKSRKETAWVDEPKPEAISEEPAPEEPAPPQEPAPKESAKEGPGKGIEDDLPVIKKPLGDLSEDEKKVLDVISVEGMTVSGIQSKIGKGMKRFALLRALRVLIDSGHVGILTKGRLELYQRINVEQMDKTDNSRSKKEVK